MKELVSILPSFLEVSRTAVICCVNLGGTPEKLLDFKAVTVV